MHHAAFDRPGPVSERHVPEMGGVVGRVNRDLLIKIGLTTLTRLQTGVKSP